MLTHEHLISRIHYCPQSGVFRWASRVKRSKHSVGDLAGSVSFVKGRYQHSIILKGKKYLAHRIARFWMTGEWPPTGIDHIDGNPANNKWDNLRLANKSQNSANTPVTSSSATGLRGVKRVGRRYRAQIMCNGQRHHLGYYPTKEMAHQAYVLKRREMFGEYARVR